MGLIWPPGEFPFYHLSYPFLVQVEVQKYSYKTFQQMGVSERDLEGCGSEASAGSTGFQFVSRQQLGDTNEKSVFCITTKMSKPTQAALLNQLVPFSFLWYKITNQCWIPTFLFAKWALRSTYMRHISKKKTKNLYYTCNLHWFPHFKLHCITLLFSNVVSWMTGLLWCWPVRVTALRR